MTITSIIARSWPLHGITIKVGENDIPVESPQRRALLERLLGPFVEAGQMTLVDDALTTATSTTGATS